MRTLLIAAAVLAISVVPTAAFAETSAYTPGEYWAQMGGFGARTSAMAAGRNWATEYETSTGALGTLGAVNSSGSITMYADGSYTADQTMSGTGKKVYSRTVVCSAKKVCYEKVQGAKDFKWHRLPVDPLTVAPMPFNEALYNSYPKPTGKQTVETYKGVHDGVVPQADAFWETIEGTAYVGADHQNLSMGCHEYTDTDKSIDCSFDWTDTNISLYPSSSTRVLIRPYTGKRAQMPSRSEIGNSHKNRAPLAAYYPLPGR